MKFYGSGFNFVIFICLCIKISSLHAAAIICNDESTQAALNTDGRMAAKDDDDNSSAAIVVNKQTIHNNNPDAMITTPPATGATDVKQFLQTVQCTLEKAKPWVATIEQEAKRIEETAKRVGAGIINRFSDLMESLMQPDTNNSDNNNSGSGTSGSSIIGSSALSLLNGLLANVAGVNELNNAAVSPTPGLNSETANVAIAENAAE